MCNLGEEERARVACIQMMNFAFQMMNFVFQMMNLVTRPPTRVPARRISVVDEVVQA